MKETPAANPIDPNDDWFDKMVDSNPVLSEARHYGIDLWALWDNLHRPVEERIRRHQSALNLYKTIRAQTANE